MEEVEYIHPLLAVLYIYLQGDSSTLYLPSSIVPGLFFSTLRSPLYLYLTLLSYPTLTLPSYSLNTTILSSTCQPKPPPRPLLIHFSIDLPPEATSAPLLLLFFLDSTLYSTHLSHPIHRICLRRPLLT